MNPAHILLIEDNPADVMLIELALQDNGISYQLTRYASGADAVKGLCGPGAGADPLPGVILLDLNTPRSNGFQVLSELKKVPRFANVPFAIITSSVAASDKHYARQQGVRLIEKPSELEKFFATVGGAIKEMLSLRR